MNSYSAAWEEWKAVKTKEKKVQTYIDNTSFGIKQRKQQITPNMETISNSPLKPDGSIGSQQEEDNTPPQHHNNPIHREVKQLSQETPSKMEKHFTRTDRPVSTRLA